MATTTLKDTAARDATVTRLLAAARETMVKSRDCWAATPSIDGGVNIRVVEPIAREPGDEDWTIWIATSGASRKAAEILRAGRLSLGYQHPLGRDYVALLGRATVVDERTQVRRRWQETWRVFFPGGPDDPNTVLVMFEVDRIELCVHGASPEPFGSRYSTLVRDRGRQWQVVPG
jgi:general stress protein 26